MKKNLVVLFILATSVSISQPVRLHIMGGFANYNGDIQQKKFTLDQAKGAVSIGELSI